MRLRHVMLAGVLLFGSFLACAQTQQVVSQDVPHQHPPTADQSMPAMDSMQHDIKELSPPLTPRLGVSQENFQGPIVSLEELEKLALKNNPTLAQASAEIAAAKGRRSQSGLWRNPTVGYVGEEIRGGSFRGGEQGFFVEQEIPLGSKLALNRKVLSQEVRQAELENEEQELRVKNAVRLLYYQAMAAQETVVMRKELSRIASEMAKYNRQLFNVGQQNETEVLDSEVTAEQADLAAIAAEHGRRKAMASLAAVVATPSVGQSTLAGSLEENLPALDQEQVLNVLVHDSPAIRIAQSGVDRAETALLRARREAVPDLRFRGGLEQNRELQESNSRPVGLQGFAEIGVELKLFNRNQGNVQAAEGDLVRARQEVKRIELVLRERAASFVDSYSTAETVVDRYRTRILPRAQRAYELLYKRYGMMQASYPQVLASQHSLYKLETEYVGSLGQLWSNAIALKGFLLTDGLEAPTGPSDVDRRVREINLPSARMGSPTKE